MAAAADAEAAARVKATTEAEAAAMSAAEVDAMAEAGEEYAKIGIMVVIGGGGSVNRGMQVGCKVGSSRGVERRGGFSSR